MEVFLNLENQICVQICVQICARGPDEFGGDVKRYNIGFTAF